MLNYSVQSGTSGDSLTEEKVDESILGFNPFPGLRPFSIEDAHLFFGREGQVDEVLFKLNKSRAVTVIGYSGSGKSSLMYCGLIPVLYGGFMTETGPHWKVIVTRPGNTPIENLTNDCINFLINEGRITEDDRQVHKAIIGSVLRNGNNGLIELTRYLQSSPSDNIFFFVDQFEELFRYKDTGGDEHINEATCYVNLLLTGVAQRTLPTYLALSMRSDFIGECASFPGLTQMINDSNYLVPQMTRDQKRMAIEGPVAVGGGRISQRLVKRLLSDIGDNQDQLPILQHALMRTWDYWIANHDPSEPMDIRHYNAVGKISQALSLHANEAYDELGSKEKLIAEILFKTITEKNSENLELRRPGKISQIAELSQSSEEQVIEVVEKFRQPGRSFLMPGTNVPLTAESIIELSHESLMRIWTRLSTWVDEEYDSALMYKRVSDAAAMYQIGKTNLWRPPDLQLALNWQKKQRPTRTWAQRYDIAFERAIVFLDTSRITYEAELKNQEMLQRRMLRRARVTNLILALLLLIATGFFIYGLFQQIKAEQQAQLAIQQKEIAEKATLDANEQKQIAQDALREVEAQKEQLDNQNRELSKAYGDIKRARDVAERNLKYALEQEALANSSKDLEQVARINAEKQTEIARNNYDKANRLLMLSIAQSLEAKSVGIDDPQLAGLTAMQGYIYHTTYEGNKYDPYVFGGLYYSLTKLNGTNYNASKVPGNFKNKMYAIAVSANSSKFYTTGNDGRIFEGNYEQQKSDKLLYENKGYPNRVLALSKDEKYLVNGSDSSYLEIINLADPAKPVKVLGHKQLINDIKFLPDNSGFISASADRTLRLTNQSSGQGKTILTLPFDLKSFDISPDGKLLIGVSTNGNLILVNLRDNSYKELMNEGPNRILSVVFHPSRPLIAYGVEQINEQRKVVRGIVKLMDLDTKRVKELSGHKAGIADLEFSPDGLLLASAGLDAKVQMWVVDHENDLPILMDNNNGFVWDISFTKGSEYLIASCNDGEIRYWPTNPAMLAVKVCPKLKRDMTPEEWEIYVGNNIGYESTCKSLLKAF
jgi:WD40 repeat protein/energy-coupling factor transporter ATP-binding protein EcfA2